ncbi:unnamed protein product [Amoebophrya sp. A25]|nr:unnamed protein product [Amoebophrya sp. A25]|eukprot:GSA25T00016613001.1
MPNSNRNSFTTFWGCLSDRNKYSGKKIEIALCEVEDTILIFCCIQLQHQRTSTILRSKVDSRA